MEVGGVVIVVVRALPDWDVTVNAIVMFSRARLADGSSDRSSTRTAALIDISGQLEECIWARK